MDATASGRPRLTPKEKEEVMKTAKCYVCSALKLDHAGFDGYDTRHVHMDHFATPWANVGGKNPDNAGSILPIHAVSKGVTADDLDFENSTNRNCHSIRKNDFDSAESYVDVIRARLEARETGFLDEVYTNKARKLDNPSSKLPVSWGMDRAVFRDKEYALISEDRRGKKWERFLVNLPGKSLFTDHTSQVREASRKSLHKMLHTFMVDGFPMFSPVNARVDKCGHVVIFDGNHRATSYALAFGVEAAMPVMIWRIAPGAECAAVPEFENRIAVIENE